MAGKKVRSKTGQRVRAAAYKHADQIRNIEELKRFERFKELLLPEAVDDVLSGKSAKEIYEKYAALVAGRMVTIALSGDDRTAKSAGSDVLDRAQGKATEKKEVKHTLEQLSDEELQAIVKSEFEDLE